MEQSGGPPAINGFLYQILHHLEWVAAAKLKGADGEAKNALLVLEPQSGGDARAEAPDRFLVEQYKTRASGTWPLSAVEAILKDLRRGVPHSFPENAHYRFVTNGRDGRLGEFRDFLSRLSSVEGPDSLNRIEKREFRRGLTGTDREFFDHLVEATRSGARPEQQKERAVVFHLLSHFEMEFCVTSSGLIERIERALRPYVANLGDESRVRDLLVGILMDRLSKGETQFDLTAIDEVLRQAGLSPDRLRKLKMLSRELAELNRHRLGRIGYRHERDARKVMTWPEGKEILVITGDSGAGKTWQLGKYLETCARTNQAATLVIGAQTTEAVLTRASSDIWQSGLGETSDKTLSAISIILRDIDPSPSIPLLTVAVDDIQDVGVARDLIRQDWVRWGMRLVLTVPSAVGRGLAITDKEEIHVHRVGEFSVTELDTLLKQHEQRWADLPSDLKRLLRKPILAGLFLELPYTSFQAGPCSEYEIFEEFWERIAAKGYRGDKGIVTTLATHAKEGKPYPLPRPEWAGIGLTEENLRRLQAGGWLRCLESGEVEFAHDRLLNWAVAKSIAREFQSGRLSVEDLYERLVNEIDDREAGRLPRLGYVPMDTLWLLAEGDTHSKALGQFLGKLNDYILRSYLSLLPTLGQRAVPILLELLSRIASDSTADYKVTLIGQALASVAEQEETDLEETIAKLLDTSSRPQQAVAIAILQAVPASRHLDRLWELHRQRRDAIAKDRHRTRDYQASFAVLRAGIELDLEWIRKQILTADEGNEQNSELAYLLAGLEHPGASAIWRDTAEVLMSKIPQSQPRSLIKCIARFEDHGRIDFVIQHLSCSQDFAGWAAIEALTVLAPQEAVDRLIHVEDLDRYVTRNQWLPHLLRVRPEQTRKRILELAQSDQRGYWLIARLFWERPDELDEAMLRCLLRTLEADLRDLRERYTDEPSILYNPLEFVGRIARPALLKVLRAEASREFEQLILEVAFSRLGTNSGSRDSILENARRILILIGGSGLTTLINRELASEHFWVRHNGLEWALAGGDECTKERLSCLAHRCIPVEASDQQRSELLQELRQAVTALAALGADSALVEILTQFGVLDAPIPEELAELRAHYGPMQAALTNPAVGVLQDPASGEELQLVSLVVAWLSGDAGLIPSVRSVLARAEPESQVARFACIALQQLGDQSDEFKQLAGQLAHSKENEHWGLSALMELGEMGLDSLLKWMHDRGTVGMTAKAADCVIRTLYRHPKYRRLAVDAAVERCLEEGVGDYPPYDIAAEAENAELREKVLEVAFSESSHLGEEPRLRAIEGLAKFDVARAIEAIERGLQFESEIERELCAVLVSIAPGTATGRLLDTIEATDRESLIAAAGRALRRLDASIVGPSVVQRMSAGSSGRELVAKLAGWLDIGEVTEALGELAEHDSSMGVRRTALAGLERLGRGRVAHSLLREWPRARREHQWGLLVALLDVADPYLLKEREDSLWIGRIFEEGGPYAFVHYAKERLDHRVRKEGQ